MDRATRERFVTETMDNIRRVFQVVNEQSKRVERETGLTGPQLWAVKIISERESMRVSDLAKAMYLNPATVVGILDRLEKRGLIGRERCRSDRRVVNILLTPEGQRLVTDSPEVASNKIIHGLEALPLEHLAMIHTGLDSLVSILDARDLTPHLIGAEETNPQGEEP